MCGIYKCEQRELPSVFNGPDFHYKNIILQAVRRSVNVLNVSTCI